MNPMIRRRAESPGIDEASGAENARHSLVKRMVPTIASDVELVSLESVDSESTPGSSGDSP